MILPGTALRMRRMRSAEPGLSLQSESRRASGQLQERLSVPNPDAPVPQYMHAEQLH